MDSTLRTGGRKRRHSGLFVRAATILLCTTLVVGGSACSKKKTDAQRADDELTKGLEAHQAGNMAEAVKHYEAVLDHDPRNKWAFYNLGLIAQTRGQSDDAVRQYQLALDTDPGFGPALYNLAIVETGPHPQKAVELYRRAIAASPDEPGPHLNLGYLLISLGQKAEGDAELAKAQALTAAKGAAGSTTTPGPSGQAPPAGG